MWARLMSSTNQPNFANYSNAILEQKQKKIASKQEATPTRSNGSSIDVSSHIEFHIPSRNWGRLVPQIHTCPSCNLLEFGRFNLTFLPLLTLATNKFTSNTFLFIWSVYQTSNGKSQLAKKEPTEVIETGNRQGLPKDKAEASLVTTSVPGDPTAHVDPEAPWWLISSHPSLMFRMFLKSYNRGYNST